MTHEELQQAYTKLVEKNKSILSDNENYKTSVAALQTKQTELEQHIVSLKQTNSDLFLQVHHNVGDKQPNTPPNTPNNENKRPIASLDDVINDLL